MLEIMNDLPPHVLGIRAKGDVGTSDMENVLLPALQQQVDNYGEIHYLLVLDTSVGNFTAGAWIRDLRAGIKHFAKWKKIAIVTSQRPVEFLSDVFTVAVPGLSRGFSADQEAEARAWVAAQ